LIGSLYFDLQYPISMSMNNLPDELILHIMQFMDPIEKVDVKEQKMNVRTNVKSVDRRFRLLWKERMLQFTPKERKLRIVQNLGFSQAIRYCLKHKDYAVLKILRESKCYESFDKELVRQ